MTQSRTQSVVMYRIGGREYPMRTIPSCKVCQSQYRLEIENEILAGRVYAAIIKGLPEGHGLTSRNVSDHYRNGHLPSEHEAVRRIVERRAEERGQSIEHGLDSLVDGLATAEVIVQKGFEAIAAGDLVPDVKDVIAAIKVLESFAGEEDGADQSAYVEAFMVYHETAARHMSPQAFADFGRDLSRNPVLKALVARFEGDDEPKEIEGSVIDRSDEPFSDTLDNAPEDADTSISEGPPESEESA